MFEGLSAREKQRLRDESVQYLATKFNELFQQEGNMSYEAFAEWEYEVATHIRCIYRNGEVRLYTYGNAQKLINVGLKFVLSSNLIDYHSPVFRNCFFPIDGIIQRTIKASLSVDFMKKDGVRTYYQPSWAKCDNWDDILDYQTRVRNAVLQYGYYSPIIWEATHWN